MATWGYPGPQRRGQKDQTCTEPRWGKPEWKSLAWATQLLAALDLFFVVMIPISSIGCAIWWLALFSTIVLFILVSVLAVRQ